MGYTKKIYGTGFKIFKKHQGWDLAIWTDSMPTSLVLMRPISEKEFIFVNIGRNIFNDADLPHMNWFLCDEEGYIKEISNEEANNIWSNLWDKKKAEVPCKVGDKVYVADQEYCFEGEVESIECDNGEIFIIINEKDIFNEHLKYNIKDFGKYVFLSEEERDSEYANWLKAISEEELYG